MPLFRTRLKLWSALAGVAFCAWSPAAANAAVDQALIAAAQKEGSVIWYSGLVVDQIIRPEAEAFQKAYPGIKVEYVSQSAGTLTQKLLAESRAGKVQVDVFDSTADTLISIPSDILSSYTPASAAPFPADYRDAQGRWNAFCVYVWTSGYNTEMIKGQDAPQTFDDLLNPKWKGKIATKILPQATGVPGFIGNILLSKGQGPGMDYLRKFSQQNLIKVPLTARGVLDQVIAGDYPLAIMIANYHAQISSSQGAPVNWIKMEPIVEVVNYAALPKNSAHPNAAKLFVEFLLSDQGQTVLREASYIPASPNVPPKDPSLAPGSGHFKTTNFTPKVLQENFSGWMKVSEELFGIK